MYKTLLIRNISIVAKKDKEKKSMGSIYIILEFLRYYNHLRNLKYSRDFNIDKLYLDKYLQSKHLMSRFV